MTFAPAQHDVQVTEFLRPKCGTQPKGLEIHHSGTKKAP
ncbi:hypothetical protein RHODOSMS8_02710 [Rhodobiaceae bacterium]|nr:hypothetical protein RHODOSMS8_02710 [Rhodobiaceae bacterium]